VVSGRKVNRGKKRKQYLRNRGREGHVHAYLFDMIDRFKKTYTRCSRRGEKETFGS